MSDPTVRPLDLPAVIKALSDVPPERQRFVGVMVVAVLLLSLIAWGVIPACLAHFLH